MKKKKLQQKMHELTLFDNDSDFCSHSLHLLLNSLWTLAQSPGWNVKNKKKIQVLVFCSDTRIYKERSGL